MDAENEKNVSKEKENVPNIKREGWDVKDVVDEAANENPDDVVRKVLREGEDKNDADRQDIAGSVDSEDTPQGREENKKDEGA